MDLPSVVAELYGLLPADFTSTRNERAKAARAEGDGDLAGQVRRLPKPSTAAWVVNALARQHREEVDQLLGLGAALRQAQDELDGEELRELNRQRRALLAAVTRQARELAQTLGHPVSEAISVEVEQTLRAAMADAEAAAAVRSGQLTAALSSSGFTPVDVSGAVAVPPLVTADETRPVSKPGRGRDQAPRGRDRDHRAERAVAEARQQAEDAEREAGQAEDRRREAVEHVREVTRRRDGLEAELAELEQRVRTVQADVSAAAREVRAAERARDQADRAAATAEAACQRARERLERLADR